MTLTSEEKEKLRLGVDAGNIPTLLMVLVQLTGNLSWLEAPYQPVRPQGLGDNPTGGLSEAIQREIRDAAFNAIIAWKEERAIALPKIPEDLLIRMLSVAMGEVVSEEFGEFTAAQLGQINFLDSTEINAPADFKVLIIGAGMSGICCAAYLNSAGVPFTVLEKAESVGGVWWENKYPGCGVDSPNHLYSYSFAPNDWSKYFVLRDELHEYFERVVVEFGLRDNIRLSTAVRSIVYDEVSQLWHAEIEGLDGIATEAFSAVISCVGLFNPPVIPRIEGLDGWTAQKWHSAQWPEDADLKGKRVGIVGVGATSMQIGPAIQDEVQSLTIFQREPHWITPHDKFNTPVDEAEQYLFQELPLYLAWYRTRLGWTFNDRLHPMMRIDPSWPHQERSVNRYNDRARILFTEYLKEQLDDQFDALVDKVLPTYPPFGKRILMDNGWFKMLRKPNVHLVTDPIVGCDENKVVTANGSVNELDVLIFATGFDGLKMVDSYAVVGREGRTLRDEWGDDDAKAYLGTMVPYFPNFFVLYGPNLQPGHGGAITFTLEMQARYVREIIREMIDREIGAVEISQDHYESYSARVDAAHRSMLWCHPSVSTYVKNKAGRVVVNSAWRSVDFFEMTKEPEFDKYKIEQKR